MLNAIYKAPHVLWGFFLKGLLFFKDITGNKYSLPVIFS